MLLTLIFSLPSIFVILNRPKYKYMKLCMFNISMSFFFFSYHVHEKTILIPLVPLLLCIKNFNWYYLDFVNFTSITLIPLMREDK
jgi:alpha-1,3-glucosyltransferase